MLQNFWEKPKNSSLGTLSQPQLLCEIFPHPPRGHPTVLAPGNVNVKCWTIIRSATNLAWFFFTAASNIIEILCPGLKAVHNQQGISCDPGPEILLTSSSLMNQPDGVAEFITRHSPIILGKEKTENFFIRDLPVFICKEPPPDAAGVVPAAHFSPRVHSLSKHNETFSKVASTEVHLHPHHIPGVPGPLQLAPLQHQLHGWGRSAYSRLVISNMKTKN